MSDYETPKIPPATPPVIDPDADPATAAEMEEDGNSEGDVPAERKEQDDLDTETESAMRPAMDGGRDGEGERAMDIATMLPPD